MTPNKAQDPDQISFGQEVARKATHLGALIIPGGYYLLNLTRQEMLTIMAPVTLFMIVVDIARLRGWSLWTKVGERVGGSLIRPHEKSGDFTGATYILLTVCLSVALFDQLIAVAAIAFIVVGDTFAALIGRRWGRHRFGGGKSWEGSFSFFFSILFVIAALPLEFWWIGLVGAVVATIAEALPWGIDDNVSVPLLSGLAMTLVRTASASI